MNIVFWIGLLVIAIGLGVLLWALLNSKAGTDIGPFGLDIGTYIIPLALGLILIIVGLVLKFSF